MEPSYRSDCVSAPLMSFICEHGGKLCAYRGGCLHIILLLKNAVGHYTKI